MSLISESFVLQLTSYFIYCDCHFIISDAFRLGLINQARWLSNDRIVAVNNDCNTKVFKVNHK